MHGISVSCASSVFNLRHTHCYAAIAHSDVDHSLTWTAGCKQDKCMMDQLCGCTPSWCKIPLGNTYPVVAEQQECTTRGDVPLAEIDADTTIVLLFQTGSRPKQACGTIGCLDRRLTRLRGKLFVLIFVPHSLLRNLPEILFLERSPG